MTDSPRTEADTTDGPAPLPPVPVSTPAPTPVSEESDPQPVTVEAPPQVAQYQREHQAPVSPFPAEADTPGSKAVWILVFVGLLALAGISWGWWIAATIVAVAVMITIHELGHYVTAKWAGMKVTEFFLGFGPRLWSFRRGETDYGVKPIMAGAYVRIVGMNNLEEVPPEDEARTYRQQSFPKRLIVVLAGPATHFLQVGVLMFLLLGVFGVPAGELGTDDPDPSDWTISDVTPDSAASAAGLRADDKVVEFNSERVDTFDELTAFIQDTEVGQEVTLTVLRDGEPITKTTEIVGRPESIGGETGAPFLGVGPGFPDVTMGLGEAILATPQQALSVTGTALSALKDNLSPDGISNFAGEVSEGGSDNDEPAASSSGSEGEDSGRFVSIIGAIQIGGASGEAGISAWLWFLVIINIFIGLINLVPLLPFDGGHAVIAIYERIRSRHGTRYYADAAKMLPVAYAVIMVLIVLGVTTMYMDIVDPVG